MSKDPTTIVSVVCFDGNAFVSFRQSLSRARASLVEFEFLPVIDRVCFTMDLVTIARSVFASIGLNGNFCVGNFLIGQIRGLEH